MAKQVMIIGLGQFGMALAQALSERSVEVMAVDISQEKVDAAAQFAAHAAAVDVTDENALAKLLPQERDSVICAMGSSAKESAITSSNQGVSLAMAGFMMPNRTNRMPRTIKRLERICSVISFFMKANKDLISLSPP